MLQVVWLYWPEDLPNAMDGLKMAKGCRSYHGQYELIPSNHMDVIDVCTFAGIASVEQWVEEDDEASPKGLYWRQTFDVRRKRLSVSPATACSSHYRSFSHRGLDASNTLCLRAM